MRIAHATLMGVAATDITLTQLRLLRQVARTGSFTATAEDLGYSQSAVSRQMTGLERAAGDLLFERGRRGVVLTAAGEMLLHAADRVLEEVDNAHARVAGIRDRIAGSVSVGAFPSAAAALVPRAIAAVLREHPAVRIVLDEAATPTLVRRVRSGRLDLAVVATTADQTDTDLADLVCHPLPRVGLFIAVAESHHLARRTTVAPEELTDEAWIVGVGMPGDPQFGAWPTLAEPRIAFRTRHWPTRLGLVAAGLGVSVLPGPAVPSVPVGVTVVAVDDPARTGRIGQIVTLPTQTSRAVLLVQALQREARALHDGLRPPLPSA